MAVLETLLPEAEPFELRRADLLRDRAFVAGRWVEGEGTFPVYDPASGDSINRVADSNAALAASAVDAAHQAFEGWAGLTAKARADVLRAWFDLVRANGEDLARLISREQGKPLTEARVEVDYGAGYLEWFAEEARRSYGDVIPPPASGRQLIVVKEPVGVTAIVTPWNFPLAMITRKVAPALAAGCTVVAKPAAETPLTALALARLAEEAGVPAGVFNVLPASRAAAVSSVWMADPRVRKLSFTGSTPVGKHLMREASATMKRLSLELGGDAPFIVFDDADLDRAIDGLIKAKFRNAGQACIAANRVYVQDGIANRFVGRLIDAVARLQVGPAFEGAFDVGPLINSAAVSSTRELIADALAGGATLEFGGGVHHRGGNFFEPTILTNVTDSMKLSCSEVFGPVVSVARFASEDEVVRRANASPYGLAAYLFSTDMRRIWRVSARLEAGLVGINEGAISTEVAPFGGIKESGHGREGSKYGLADYQNIKYLCLGGLD